MEHSSRNTELNKHRCKLINVYLTLYKYINKAHNYGSRLLTNKIKYEKLIYSKNDIDIVYT